MIGSMASTPNPAAQAATLIVDIDSHDNNSAVTLSSRTIEQLQLVKGDVVLVENAQIKRVVPFTVLVGDDNHDTACIKLNPVAGGNLRTQAQNQVTVSKLPSITFALQITVAPIDASFEGQTGALLENVIHPYFRGFSRPTGVGDLFTATQPDGTSVEFCVTNILPAPYASVNSETTIHTDGKPISQSDAEKWHEKAGAGDISYIRDLYNKGVTAEDHAPTLSLVDSPDTVSLAATDSCPGITTTPPKDHVEHREFAESTPSTASPNSPSYPQLYEVQTMPEIRKHFTTSSTASGSESPNTLWHTQSYTAVRDFAPMHSPVKQTGFKRYFKNLTPSKLFIPQTYNPGFDPHNIN